MAALPSRCLAVAALLLLAACASPAVPPTEGEGEGRLSLAPKSPAPGKSAAPSKVPAKLTTKVTADDLSGNWYVGTGAEPPSGPYVALPCSAGDRFVSLSHKDGKVSWSCACNLPPKTDAKASLPFVDGKLAGEINIQLTAGTFDMVFDKASSHFRGTLDGKPAWIVPQAENAYEIGQAMLDQRPAAEQAACRNQGIR